jgi:hypothetical protein
MSKNMTRKGLAVGTVAALSIAGFITAPAAYAAGVDDTSSLLPTSGYSDGYAVPASATQTFSLTYVTNETSGGTIKFRVTDPTGKIEPTETSSGRAVAVANNAVVAITVGAGATDVVKITNATLAAGLATGDRFIFEDDLNADDGNTNDLVIASDDTLFTATVSGNDVSFTTDIDLSATTQNAVDVVGLAIRVVREARASDNSYIIDTGAITSGTAADRTRAVVFRNTDGVSFTRSATVQGWVDNANLLNDRVDNIESLSPARDITFIKPADIVYATSLTAPKVGDSSLAATITTTPVLNGAQIAGNAADFVRAVFTRQTSEHKIISGAATQSTTTGSWSASVNTDGNDFKRWVDSSTNIGADVNNFWGLTQAATPDTTGISIATTGVVTVTTNGAHNLRSGDKVTMVVNNADSAVDVAAETARTITVTSSTTFTYTVTETGTITAASKTAGLNNGTEYTIQTNGNGVSLVQRVFAGDHSAQAAYRSTDDGNVANRRYTAAGTASTLGTSAPIAADVKFTTTGSASVQGSAVTSDDSTTDSLLKAGTLTADVVATVLDEDGAAVGAGRAVVWTMTPSAATIKVNGRTSGTTTLTDANGQVKFTVTDTLGLNGSTVKITATAEGVAASVSSFSFEWATQAYTLYDLNTSSGSALATSTRRVAPGASYDLALLIADQWYQPAADADYRLKVQGAGVTEGFVSLTGGKATVKVTDNKVSTSFVSNLTVQKKGTTGTFADTTTVVALTTATSDKVAVTLGANATALYAAVTVDTADLVAAKALVERDNRVAFVEQPAYTNDVVLAGKVTNSSTGASQANAVVTISGATSILFSNGAVDKRGSITLVSDANGEFAVTLYSTTAQTDTVITVASMGVSSTTKVTFTGIGVGEGTKLDVTTPVTVDPASTFQVKAKLSDAFGNGVEATAGRVKVTYTGPGIVFGSLPDKTDKNGELSFSVLLGSNDKNAITVVVSYDQNGDGDFVDTKDLNTTKTISVGATAEVTAVIGSFNGRVAVRVENAKGSTVSVKIGKSWYKYSAISNNYLQSWKSRKGTSVAVSVYVDGELQNVQTITVK